VASARGVSSRQEGPASALAADHPVKLSCIPVIYSANCHDHAAAPSENSPKTLQTHESRALGASEAQFYLKARAIAFRADYAVLYEH
jgi:hypothetical protein